MPLFAIKKAGTINRRTAVHAEPENCLHGVRKAVSPYWILHQA